MEVFIRLLELTLPALVVFLVTYLTIRRFLEEDYRRKLLEIKREAQSGLLPNRLLAYERLTLLMERLRADALLLRVNEPGMNATTFKHVLENNIRDEYAHNVSQQIYVSEQAWQMITSAKDRLLFSIDRAYEHMKEGDNSATLGKAILQDMIHRNEHSVELAIQFLKKEVELMF